MHTKSFTIAGACALALSAAVAYGASAATNRVIAYEEAFAARDYDAAIRHAASGCVEERDLASCRRLAALPIHIGNAGTIVPAALGERLKETSAAVCRSPAPYRDILGRDVTARECAHLARRFVLAHDPEYRTAFAPETARFFASIYEPARAAGLRRTSEAAPGE